MDDKAGGFAAGSHALHEAIETVIKRGQPAFFDLAAQLPSRGRTNIPKAASDSMWVVLKTYASGGENELHSHPHEDHTFIVLQGNAKFFGPAGEEKIIGLNEGVLLPHGTFYWFQACGDVPLVMARIGASAGAGDRFARIGADGAPMAGDDPRNKEEPAVLSDAWYGRG